MELFVTFIVFNIINVIIQTVKSIATIKCGKIVASAVNALAYGLYTYIVVLTMCELPLLTKCIIVAACNFLGVWVVKYFEEKARKDKLWLVKITIPKNNAENVEKMLKEKNIAFSYIDIQKYVVFDTYCYTQKETLYATEICKQNNGKMFASENKLGLN